MGETLSAERSICERSPVKDSFQQALGETLSILTESKMVSTLSDRFERVAEALKTAHIRETRAPEGAADGASRDLTHERMFAALREAALVCVRCPHLARSRTQVVFGVGNPNAELMFVGEAPGADEDAQGEPFVGRAGQLLTKIIEAMGFRREDVYIANVLKCRPDMPPGSSGNRKPTPGRDEDLSALARKQIELIKPRVMVALGATALEGLLGATTAVNKLRGRWLDFHGFRSWPPITRLLVAQPIRDRKAQGLGRHAASAGAAREANQRKARRFFTKTES